MIALTTTFALVLANTECNILARPPVSRLLSKLNITFQHAACILPFAGNQLVVARPLELDERMIALAAAISIDYDYFSRHSSVGSGFFPPPIVPVPAPTPAPTPGEGGVGPEAAGEGAVGGEGSAGGGAAGPGAPGPAGDAGALEAQLLACLIAALQRHGTPCAQSIPCRLAMFTCA